MSHSILQVLHLKCGVSVSKRNDSECAWVEEAEFNDVSDKKFGDFFIAPQSLNNSTSIISSPCKDNRQIKLEFDSNSSVTENLQVCLPLLYPEERASKLSDRNQRNLENQRSPIHNDCIDYNQTSRLSIVEDGDENNKLQKTNDSNIQGKEKEENIEGSLPKNFEDSSDAVVVRPIPAESPEEIQKQRRASFDGKFLNS